MDNPVKTSHRRKVSRPAKAVRVAAASGEVRTDSTVSEAALFPAGVPDAMPSSEAKDRISDVVKKAAGGGRTTIISRGYPIAIIGPLEDIPGAALENAARLPTTEIKSGQTSLKGIIAREDCAVLTVHGEARAAVYRPMVRHRPAETEDKLDRLILLLRETRAIERQNKVALELSGRLERLLASLLSHVEKALDGFDGIKPNDVLAWRTEYTALKKAFEGIAPSERPDPEWKAAEPDVTEPRGN